MQALEPDRTDQLSNWTWPAIWNEERGGWWRFPATFGLVLFATRIHLPPLRLHPPVSVLMLAALLAGVGWVHRKPIRCLFTDGRPFGIRLAVQSALLWALLWLASSLLVPNGWQGLAQRAGEIASGWRTELPKSLLSGMVLTAVFEEVFFRGYLLPRFGAWLKRPWLAVGLTALLFTAAHFGQGRATYVAIAFWGVFVGIAGVRAGTLAPLLALHATNNWLIVLCEPHHDNRNTTWLDVSIFIVTLLIWFGWLLWATRQKPVQTLPQPGGPANPSQPTRSETNPTSVAAGSDC